MFIPRALGFSACSSLIFFDILSIASLSATGTLTSPETAIAFKFFEPITAPVPPLPAVRVSDTIALKSTCFSPAGPINATRDLEPAFSLIIFSASEVLRPQTSSAE